jgi:hypothetical protein
VRETGGEGGAAFAPTPAAASNPTRTETPIFSSRRHRPPPPPIGVGRHAGALAGGAAHHTAHSLSGAAVLPDAVVARLRALADVLLRTGDTACVKVRKRWRSVHGDLFSGGREEEDHAAGGVATGGGPRPCALPPPPLSGLRRRSRRLPARRAHP